MTDPTAAAAEIGRFAFFMAMFPMGSRARGVLLSSLHLWWSDGRRGLARLRSSYAQRSGAVTHAPALAKVLHEVEAHGIVVLHPELGEHVWDLLDPSRWRWPPGEQDRARIAWERATKSSGWTAPKAMELLRSIVARLPDTAWIGTRRGRPTFHPDDRSTRDWHDQLVELTEEFGEPAVLDALREIAEDPETMPRWSPGVLRETAWAAVIRRRAREARNA